MWLPSHLVLFLEILNTRYKTNSSLKRISSCSKCPSFLKIPKKSSHVIQSSDNLIPQDWQLSLRKFFCNPFYNLFWKLSVETCCKNEKQNFVLAVDYKHSWYRFGKTSKKDLSRSAQISLTNSRQVSSNMKFITNAVLHGYLLEKRMLFIFINSWIDSTNSISLNGIRMLIKM